MTEDQALKNLLRSTSIIYFSLVIGLLFFFVMAIMFIQGKEAQVQAETNNVLTVVVPVFGFMMMILSKVFYNKMITKKEFETDLQKKIIHYRSMKIISWAMIESACIFAFTAVMITSNNFYLVVFIFLFGYFILLKPSRESLIRDLQLNSDEINILQRTSS
ncbi:MAG: hypothetical protein ACHQLA_00965 [Ignavibacteriales bacterium]